MTEKSPVCGGTDPETEEIFQRAITHVLDFAEAVIRERWQTDGATEVDIHADWYDALVEGLIAAATEVAFRAGSGDAASQEQIAEDLRGMLASHVEAVIDEPVAGSMVQ